MGFRGVNLGHISRFNSSVSFEFLESYNKFLDSKILSRNSEPSHRTFSGSSFRCDRRSWFRIRGTQPDTVNVPDATLEFTARVGTQLHLVIQRDLTELFGDNWISVSDYLKNNPIPYKYTLKEEGYETQIHIEYPPARLACDGIVKINGEYYLFEFKTSEFSSWDNLTDPKQEHIDQARFYCTILGLKKVIFLYQDRQYGGLKCYEIAFNDGEIDEVKIRMDDVMQAVEYNLAPAGLPVGDKWCSPSMCPYYKKCQEYGR